MTTRVHRPDLALPSLIANRVHRRLALPQHRLDRRSPYRPMTMRVHWLDLALPSPIANQVSLRLALPEHCQNYQSPYHPMMMKVCWVALALPSLTANPHLDLMEHFLTPVTCPWLIASRMHQLQ